MDDQLPLSLFGSGFELNTKPQLPGDVLFQILEMSGVTIGLRGNFLLFGGPLMNHPFQIPHRQPLQYYEVAEAFLIEDIIKAGD